MAKYLDFRVLKMDPEQRQTGTDESYEITSILHTFCLRKTPRLDRLLDQIGVCIGVISIVQCHIARRALFTLSTSQCKAVKIYDFTVCVSKRGV